MRRMRTSQWMLGAVLLIAVAAGQASAASADDLQPQEISITTPIYRPYLEDFTPALGTYKYNVTWQGIPAADVSISVARDGRQYRVSTEVKTLKGIDLIYKLRYKASAEFSAIDFLPQRSEYHQRENSRVKDTEITFLPNGEILSVRKKGNEVQRLQFDPRNFTLDPFSAAFLARSLDWKKGATKYFDTFEGKNRYLVSLTATNKINMLINGREREVWVITPKVRKLGSDDKKKKLRDARIYLTADSRREIIMIESEVFIGTVKTKMVSFAPSTTSVAQENSKPRFIK